MQPFEKLWKKLKNLQTPKIAYQWFRSIHNMVCTESRMRDECVPASCLLGCKTPVFCNVCASPGTNASKVDGNADQFEKVREEEQATNAEAKKIQMAKRSLMEPHTDKCADSLRHYISCFRVWAAVKDSCGGKSVLLSLATTSDFK